MDKYEACADSFKAAVKTFNMAINKANSDGLTVQLEIEQRPTAFDPSIVYVTAKVFRRL